jgi:hypothetical protein
MDCLRYCREADYEKQKIGDRTALAALWANCQSGLRGHGVGILIQVAE